jgi:hypothetical protein
MEIQDAVAANVEGSGMARDILLQLGRPFPAS